MAKLKDVLKKVARYVPAVLGAIGGTALGGPVGGIAGGALGGASTRSDKNKLKGALKGAGIGGLYVAGAPSLFNALGGAPGGMFSTLTGSSAPSFLSQVGISSAPKIGGGLGFFGNMGQQGILQGAGGIKGFASKIPGGKYLLPATQHALGRMGSRGGAPQELSRREMYDPGGYGSSLVNPVQGVSLPEAREQPRSEGQSKRVSDIVNNPHLSALDKLLQILHVLEADNAGQQSAQMAQNLQREEVPHDSFDTEEYKRGGYVNGKTGGQDDKVPRPLQEGDYVMNATSTSLLGDGNSANGGEKIKEFENKFVRTGIVRNPSRSYSVRTVNAKVSPGEYIIKRHIVDAIGGGNNKKGAKALDKFNINLRAHKGIKRVLPPKSKPIEHYFGKGIVK